MRRGIAALTCALVYGAGGLKTKETLAGNDSQHRFFDPEPESKSGHLHSGQTTVLTHNLNGSNVEKNWTHQGQEHAGASAAEHDDYFFGCNSSACNVDVVRLHQELQNDLVLVLGCSLDINAINYFCDSVGAPVLNFETKNPFAYLAHCDVGKFTVAYAFHPGASPPPYFGEYGGTATTMDIVKNSVYDVQLQFGKEPTAIIVDSSLWDVSNWWEKHGRPQSPYPLPQAEITQWCTRDVPQLLRWVQTVYPRSQVAFRTPPTVFPDNGYGQDPVIIDAMVKCVEEQKDPLQRLYGQFGFIDFHNFVDQVLQHAAGPAMKTYYKDSLHPGASLSLMYMNRVLNWVRGLRHI